MSFEKAKITLLEMLKQRGCTIIDIDSFIAMKPDGKQLIVFFNEASSFDTKNMKEIITVMNETYIMHSIVVYKHKVTPSVKGNLSQLDDMKIELFAVEDLQYNITKHRLQPIFEKLDDEEAIQFKKKYGTQFGILRYDRPISRFYDYKKNDVIRIIRKDGYITYRIVK